MLKKLTKHPFLTSIGAFFALLSLYYLLISIIGPYYTKVCSKGEYGPPDHCEYWDAVTAIFLRLVFGLDEHEGLVTALASVFVAAFTGVLWYATEKLWKESKESRRDNRRAIYANLVAARAARKSAETAARALLADLRPLIAVIDLTLHDTDATGIDPRVTFGLRNVGSRTAIFVSLKVWVCTFEADQKNRKISHEAVGVGTSIEPKEETEKSAIFFRSTLLTADTIQQIKARKLGLFLQIDLEMSDVFGTRYPTPYPFLFDPAEWEFIRCATVLTENDKHQDEQ